MDENEEYFDDDYEEHASIPVKGTSLSSYSVDDLNQMLDEVLSEENYERAAEIRDELKKRQQQS